jgi:SWI/SNF-related matrix-associated actin-dependent regulator 1 of chromatin subfamily A
MPALAIDVVGKMDNTALLQARKGKPGQFRAFNDVCNELNIRFVPALRARAAPSWSLLSLRDRLKACGIEFNVEDPACDRSPPSRPCVVLLLHDERVHVFRGGAFLGSEMFAAYRQVFSEAGIGYDRDWAAHILDLSSSVIDELCSKLRGLGFELDVGEELRRVLASEEMAEVERSEQGQDVAAALAQRGLRLYPYQLQGVQWLTSRRRGLLADEMGLGKTAQALVALAKDASVLVVCPAVAKGVWRIEAAKWRPELSVEVVSGRGAFRWPRPGEVLAVNYEVLPDAPPEPCPGGLTLIVDEAHAVKNPDAKRTARLGTIAAAARKAQGNIWLLTGTPLLNHPKELWTVLSQARLHTDAFGSWARFMKLFGAKYVEVVKDVWTVEWGEPSAEARAGLAKVMLRRIRDEVLAELPPKRYETIVVDDIDAVTQRKCAAAEKALLTLGVSLDANDDELLASLQRRLRAVLGKVSAARKALSRQKGRVALAIVEEHEAQQAPLVVFSAYRPVIDELSRRAGWAAITGDTPPDVRAEIQQAFQRGELLGVAATIRAGGTSLTLTRASRALFVDLEWTPGINAQAEDRLCRIGQRSSVLVTRLVADVALDRRVTAALARKTSLLEAAGLSA